MPFTKGQSGNPKGRIPKPRTGPDKLRAKLLADAPAILAKLVELAKDGDIPAAKEVLSRCLPPLRPRDAPVSLPLGDDLAAASEVILTTLGAGAITLGEAASAAATIGSLARVAELTEFSRRLDDIERSLNESKQP